MPEPLVDAILAYAVEHPTHGQRAIADALARERFGGWRVSHGGAANVLRRAGLGRRLARLAAAESLAASEGGLLTERVLREVRAIERATTVHIGSDMPGEELTWRSLRPRVSAAWARPRSPRSRRARVRARRWSLVVKVIVSIGGD